MDIPGIAPAQPPASSGKKSKSEPAPKAPVTSAMRRREFMKFGGPGLLLLAGGVAAFFIDAVPNRIGILALVAAGGLLIWGALPPLAQDAPVQANSKRGRKGPRAK